MRKSKAIFLDRDGVIIYDKDFIIEPSDMEFFPETVKALKAIPSDYLKIVVSNQSGVGRGYFTIEQLNLFNDNFLAELKKNGVFIDKLYYCPHSPDDNCNCRKPKPGMFEQARQRFGIDFSKSWMIGDKSSDILAGKNIGARTILVKTGYAGGESGVSEVQPDFYADNLFQAVEIIINES